MKKFNTTGTCFPKKHYMVDISGRISRIMKMVEDGEYFCINRGRQYGKTTTLSELKKRLDPEYTAFSISFESVDDDSFAEEGKLCYAFLDLLKTEIIFDCVDNVSESLSKIIDDELERASDSKSISIAKFNVLVTRICKVSEKPVVIIIDEVDQASNYSSFIKFLGMIRDKYLKRDKIDTFQSVILAGVYSIKNLKLKIRPEGQHQYNSPWNIAVNFDIDMSLSEEGIAGMLADYESEHHVGMDIPLMASLIRDYTSGYPFLVSRLCQIMAYELVQKGKAPDLAAAWTKEGFLSAVQLILLENNTLFDDMIKKIDQFPELKELLKQILCDGIKPTFNSDDMAQSIACMFNFIKNADGKVAVSNRLFETRLYNLFIYQDTMADNSIAVAAGIERNLFVTDGKLDMERVLERFIVSYTGIYGNENETFHEKQGRKLFMMYISPIINGTGHYYIEAETRDETRTDMVINYHDQQFILEMKIWRGNAYNERGEKQTCDYLEHFGETKGYLLSFCFNKNKKAGMNTVRFGKYTIVEAVV